MLIGNALIGGKQRMGLNIDPTFLGLPNIETRPARFWNCGGSNLQHATYDTGDFYDWVKERLNAEKPHCA
jgi:hypothetical protein